MPKAILVTGAAGFIGARFVETCRERGVTDVISVDDPAHFRDRPEHGAIDFGTIVGRDDLFDWLERERPSLEGIVHLGACTDTTMMDVALLNRLNLDYSKRIRNYAAAQKITPVYAS